MNFDITKVVEEIVMQAKENQEEFIFETIRPYCENILQMKINKKELEQILLNGMQKQQPCEDCISREAVDEYIINLLSGYLYDEERTRLEDLTAYIWELPSVTPQQKRGHWILLDECSNSGYYCSECHKKVIKEGWSNTVKKVKYCPNCGARMIESEETE